MDSTDKKMEPSIDLQIYILPSCSTCRKALNWLNNANIPYEIINIVDNPPSRVLLEKAFISLGNRKYLFNTSGISYRKLGAKVVARMSDDEALDALSMDGKLVKRPFMVFKKNQILTGFNFEKWEEFFS